MSAPHDSEAAHELVISQGTAPGDIPMMTLLSRHIGGEFPFTHTLTISDAAPTTAIGLLSPDLMLIHSVEREDNYVALGEGPDFLVYTEVWKMLVRVVVAAKSVPVARDIARSTLARAPRIAVDQGVDVRTWCLDTRGPLCTRRPLAAHEWAASKVNYPPPTQSALNRIMAMNAEPERGRLMFWHGAPGTGKTNALRALAYEWADWCDVHVVTDAPQFFASSTYMSHVLTSGEADERGKPNRNKLLVMEDADEFLSSRDFAPSAGAFGRLLNLTDGVIGDGTGALVLMTTNVDAATLDPALTRRGRCFASVRFAEFSPDDAREWLPDGARGPRGPVTLSDLYSRGSEFL